MYFNVCCFIIVVFPSYTTLNKMYTLQNSPAPKTGVTGDSSYPSTALMAQMHADLLIFLALDPGILEPEEEKSSCFKASRDCEEIRQETACSKEASRGGSLHSCSRGGGPH